MKKNYKYLLELSSEKTISAINLVEASLDNLELYRPDKYYTPKEMEPYDALCDRFIRAVESSIKLFKTYEYFLNTAASDTYRDILNNMMKYNLITSVELWIDMRDIRNRVVHDYLPGQVKEILDLIMNAFKDELLLLKKKIHSGI